MNSQLCIKTRPLVRTFHIGTQSHTSKPSPLVDSIIRVDHAGELGADRIYAGQMAVLGRTQVGPLIQHMWDQEKVHKETFEKLIVKHRVRPTALIPIWNIAGFLLGAGTALLGEKAAMACTVAVESVIVEHYNDQLRVLMNEPDKNKELMLTIQKFRDDEQEHHDVGIDYGAEQAPFYKALSEVIKFGCKTAIAMSKGLLTHQNQPGLAFNRMYSTSVKSKNNLKWDLCSTVCLERKPVIVKPFTELEKNIIKVFSELEYERSNKSDHEIKGEADKLRIQMLKENAKQVNLDTILEQTAHEFEELSNKEFDSFQLAPRLTEADKVNDVHSLKRKLDSHLTLLVKEKLPNNLSYWFFPRSNRIESETMREAAERSIKEAFGDSLKVLFLGNAPCGFCKIPYPENKISDSRGLKLFFFKAIYLSGNLKLIKNEYEDYTWATRKELYELVDKKYHKNISQFLIKEEDEIEDTNLFSELQYQTQNN